MGQLSPAISKQRSERRIAVRLPLTVRGRDARGVTFEEETAGENLCRNGAAFVTHFDIGVGTDLEIRIPFSQQVAGRNKEPDFSTQGRVVHVHGEVQNGQRIVGVQFTGPRFRRLFRSENVA